MERPCEEIQNGEETTAKTKRSNDEDPNIGDLVMGKPIVNDFQIVDMLSKPIHPPFVK